MELGAALSGAVEALEEAGIDTPRLDAELLLAEAAGLSREEIYTQFDVQLAKQAAKAFARMVRRRTKREPVAYILGRAYFRNLTLHVNRHVLIPRPETEALVELAEDGERALDVGAGSGAVALAIADEHKNTEVTGTDTSAMAIVVARNNASRLGLAVEFIQADLITGGPYDLVVSNPPYVREDEWHGLQPEIREFEPRQALVAGPDGLGSIRRLVAGAPQVLKRGGRLALEVGAGQASEVVEMMQRAGFSQPQVIKDLAGIDRVIWAHSCSTRHPASQQQSLST